MSYNQINIALLKVFISLTILMSHIILTPSVDCHQHYAYGGLVTSLVKQQKTFLQNCYIHPHHDDYDDHQSFLGGY